VRPSDLGTFFDVLAERGSRTGISLSRPLDIAPDDGTSYGVAELAELVRAAAGWLAALGSRPGGRVAIVKDNHWDYALLAFAAARTGAVPALISAHLAPDVQRTLLKRLDPAVLVTTGGVLRAAREAGVELTAFAARTLALDGFDGAVASDAVASDAVASDAVTLDDVRGHRAPPPQRRHEDDPLVIMHTSGTTGVPKLVVHSGTTLLRRIVGFEARRWPLLAAGPSDTVAVASSYAHGRSVAWTAAVLWLRPRHAVIVAGSDPALAEPALRAHPPTMLEALPATFIRWQPMASSPEGNPFGDVRLYVSTFDAMHPPAIRTFLRASRRRHPVWMQGWGQSETGPLTFRFLTRKALAGQQDRHPTTRDLGRPVPLHIRLRVVDPQTFKPVRRGQPGLMLTRTGTLCPGYIGEQERWEDKLDGRWWNTGDIGVRTRSGSVLFLDREVDAIPGMSCVEIEDVVDERLRQVLECIILGVPGQPPVPVVVTADGLLDLAAWQAAVSDLPRLAEPHVFTWDEIPRTGTGKVQRQELRTRLLATAETYGTGRWT
jgi:acyl-coenzyme A synthetase/AMP-(fatty) acid ligase